MLFVVYYGLLFVDVFGCCIWVWVCYYSLALIALCYYLLFVLFTGFAVLVLFIVSG